MIDPKFRSIKESILLLKVNFQPQKMNWQLCDENSLSVYFLYICFLYTGNYTVTFLKNKYKIEIDKII